MIEVTKVDRDKKIVWMNDGYYDVICQYHPERRKVEFLKKTSGKDRMFEAMYIPRSIYLVFVKRVYAIFTGGGQKRKRKDSQDQPELNLK